MSAWSPENAKAYYRIGEVGRICGVKAHVLRYWESEFAGLKPVKSGTGQRLYTPDHIAKIFEIKRLLHEERYTIEGAKSALGTNAANSPVEKPVADAIKRVVEGLKSIRAILE